MDGNTSDKLLYVDIRALIKTNFQIEIYWQFIRCSLLNWLKCLIWLCRGVPYLNQQIAKKLSFNTIILPYHTEVISFLKDKYEKSQNLVLVSPPTLEKFAKDTAQHLKIFSQVVYQSEVNTIKNDAYGNINHHFKLPFTDSNAYDFLGNKNSNNWLLANAEQIFTTENAGRNLGNVANTNIHHIPLLKKSKFISFLRAIRIHQYTKNLLIFVPLLTAHCYGDKIAWLTTTLGFIIFCLTVSSVYILNDLLDLSADRQHRTKHKRPFAAGDISVFIGIITAPILLLFALLLSLFLSTHFLIILLVYYALTLAYSFNLKKRLLIDVLILSTLYTLRIIAGIAALSVSYSPWLLSFSLFFFLSLAFAKRFIELQLAENENIKEIPGRAYTTVDLPLLRTFGVVSGFLSTLVFAFYINSNEVIALYSYPQWLWAVCFLLLYWIGRIWILVNRATLDEDPVMFAIQDKTTLLVAAAIVLVVFFASI